MSLKGAIERARQNGHPEPLGLGFESAIFPEMEEGVHLLRQLTPWLANEYPGRMVSWRLQHSVAGEAQVGHGMTLEAEVVMEMNRDLAEGRQFREEVVADHGFQLLEGWRATIAEDKKSSRRLLSLKLRLQTNREVWSSPRIEFWASVVITKPSGERSNVADVINSQIWSGGLERGIARVIAKNIAPVIEQQIGQD